MRRRAALLICVAQMLLGLLETNDVFGQAIVPLERLTTLPKRDDARPMGNGPQLEKKKELEIPETAKIVAPLAWNREDAYQPPDFAGFFPDSETGGRQLDALLNGDLGGNHTSAEFLSAVRLGFRRTKVSQGTLLSTIGHNFIWGIGEQDPLAIELMYHASDVQLKEHWHTALYYGPLVVKAKSDNLLRMLLLRYDFLGWELQHRMEWGIRQYSNVENVATRLEWLLLKPDALTELGAVAAYDLHQKLAGKAPDVAETLLKSGRFAVGFTHPQAQTEDELWKQLAQWLQGDEAILDFVQRNADGKSVGVALVQGIGARGWLLERIAEDRDATLVFAETLSPVVLQQRQLREFARFLPQGLPEGAKPRYAPLPEKETFAWNAAEYVPPDFNAYFPDDAEAGTRLDELYENREKSDLTSREMLAVIRQGFRHAKIRKNQLMGWVSTLSGWPEDPMQREIAYHAADPRVDKETRHNAEYFGLRGWWKKSDNVLRLFAEILISETYDHYLGNATRGDILWSLRDEREKKIVAEHLDRLITERHKDLPAEQLYSITNDYTQLTQHKPAVYDEYKDKGFFAVVFRYKHAYAKDQVRTVITERYGKEPGWEELFVMRNKEEWSPLLIIRGMDGMERIVEKLQKDKELVLDGALPTAALELSKLADPELKALLRKYLKEEPRDAGPDRP